MTKKNDVCIGCGFLIGALSVYLFISFMFAYFIHDLIHMEICKTTGLLFFGYLFIKCFFRKGK